MNLILITGMILLASEQEKRFKMAKKKPQLYRISLTGTASSLAEALKVHDKNLSIDIIEKVCYAIDHSLSYIDIAEIISPYEVRVITSYEINYLTNLEVNMLKLVEYEEYEVCAKAKHYINILKEKNSRKNLVI